VALLWQRDRATRLSVEILQLTKHPIKKIESRACRVALFADGRTDTQRRHVPRLA